MALDPASKTRDRIFIGGCVLATLLSLGGVWYVATGQERVLDVLRAKPPQVATLNFDYTDRDGQAHHVGVSGDARDPVGLAASFREQIDQSFKDFPPRR